jgi:hypothetical protein
MTNRKKNKWNKTRVQVNVTGIRLTVQVLAGLGDVSLRVGERH